MSSPPPPPGWNPPSSGPGWPPPPGPGGMPPGPGGYGAPGSTPPPFGAPGTPPPFGMPGPPPPPRRSSAGPLLAIIIGGGLAVVVLIAVVLFVVLSQSEKSATERLTAGASKLSASRALSLRGTFGSSTDRLQGEVKVTRSGRVTGPVTWDGEQVTLLSTDGNVFVKAERSYWNKQLTSSDVNQFVESGQRWGRIEPTKLGFDFKQYLTPTVLASKMRAVSKYSVRSEVKTEIQGRKAVKISTISATYYMSEDGDNLLRVESVVPSYATDVIVQTSSQAISTVNEMRTEIGELSNALDVTKTASVSQVQGCQSRSVSGCTVRVRISASGGSGQTQAQVYVWITATTPNPGKNLGDCTASVTVPESGTEWTECRVSSSAWSSFFGNDRVDRKWVMHARAIAAGTSQSEIQNLQNNLSQD